MTNSQLVASDIDVWGLKARGVKLLINPMEVPDKTLPWIVDAEWNQDGTPAGIGITTDGLTVYFYTQTLGNAFFDGASLVGHNLKDDVQMLRQWGFNVRPDQIVWDTMVAEYVRDSTTNLYGLKDLARKKYGAEWPDYEALCGKGKASVSIGTLALDIVANYNGCDVLFTYKLYKDQLIEMTATQHQYMQSIELPTLCVLLLMEERGIQIDTTYLRSLDVEFSTEISGLVTGFRDLAGATFNPNSPVQVKRLILEQTGKKLASSEADTLVKHQEIPLVKNILRYRRLTKLKGTYTGPLIMRSNGADSYRLHARFNQCVTQTGRLSSSTPNLQNIPIRTPEGALIRKAFVPSLGNILLDVDYSQIQPCLMAHHSQDPAMLEIFHSGKSIYTLVSGICDLLDRFNGNQKEAKAVAKILWLALAFNAGAHTLADQTGLNVSECFAFMGKMESKLETFFYWKNKTIAEAEINGHVTTLFGRRIPLRPGLAHLGPNYIIQGGESEIVKLAQAATAHIPSVCAIHDELLFDVPVTDKERYKREIEDIMPNIVTLTVPLRVEVGEGVNWLEAKS